MEASSCEGEDAVNHTSISGRLTRDEGPSLCGRGVERTGYKDESRVRDILYWSFLIGGCHKEGATQSCLLQPGCRAVECRGGRSGLVGSTGVQPCLRQSIPRHRWTMDAALLSPEPPAGYCPVPFAVNWMKSGPRGIHKITVQPSINDCVTQLNPCVGKKISWYKKARKVSHKYSNPKQQNSV